MKARIQNNKDLIQQESNKTATNIFVELIYNKINCKFTKLIPYLIHRCKTNSFINKIYKGSPSFDILWQIADFIKIAEAVFCYDNSINNMDIGLYSSKNYNEGTNGFKVTEPWCIITIKLFAKSKQVALEIERTNGERMRTNISFTDQKWEHNPTIYDEMVLEQVIKSINKKVLKLFDYCYDLR